MCNEARPQKQDSGRTVQFKKIYFTCKRATDKLRLNVKQMFEKGLSKNENSVEISKKKVSEKKV